MIVFSPDEQSRITCLLAEAEAATVARQAAIIVELAAVIGPERLAAIIAGDRDSHVDFTGWEPISDIRRLTRGK